MKYAVEMGSGAIIYFSSFVEICLDIQKLIGRDTQKGRQHGDLVSLLVFFFQNEESRLKRDTLRMSMPESFNVFPFLKKIVMRD
jgi:hypothetical protein